MITQLTYELSNDNYVEVLLNPVFNNCTGEYEISNCEWLPKSTVTDYVLDFLTTVFLGDCMSPPYKMTIELATDLGSVIYFIKKYMRGERWFFIEEFYYEHARLAWSYMSEYGYRSNIDNERVYFYKKRHQSMFIELSQRRLSNYPRSLDATICFFAEEIKKLGQYVLELSEEERRHSYLVKRHLYFFRRLLIPDKYADKTFLIPFCPVMRQKQMGSNLAECTCH